jgi:hypothetical protein
LNEASLVVVGHVQRLAKIQPAAGDHQVLYRVQLSKELIVKGTAAGSSVEFYSFIDDPSIGLYRADSYLAASWGAVEGTRNAFFLIREGSIFRTVTDGYLSSFPVTERAIPSAQRPETPAQILAELVLGPRPERSPDLYDLRVAKYLVGPLEAFRLFRLYLTDNDPAVRRTACLAANLQFEGQDACLDAIINDIHAPPRMRDEATGLAEQARLTTERRRREVRAGNIEPATDTISEEGAIGNLQILAEYHSDAQIRRAACRALLKRYPSAVPRSCLSE